MQTHSQIARGISLITLLIAVWMIITTAPRAFAQDTVIEVSFAKSSKELIPVNILTGQSCLVVFDKAIGRLAVSNLDTAEAVLVAPDQMSVNGKGIGRARFTVWSKEASQFIFLDVDVRANLAQIDSQVRALFPKEDIRLSQANGSVVISGNVEPKVSQQVETVIQAAGFKTVNLLVQPILNATQVQIQIRVAEVSRNKLSELAASPVVQTQSGQGGYTNTGLGPYSVNSVTEGNILGSVASSLNLFVMSNNAFLFLRALQTQGALRALAEPNLIAMNGQQASFLAGGEIPIPFVQGGGGSGSAVSIIFKEYGVRVNFKPTILDEQHIRLELEPEVSTLDYGNAVRLSGFLIPALRVRRAKTGIELQDGQSFGIAGLLDNSEQKSLSKIPILADVPILGNLFKSKSFQKNESELIFIVTAKIVRPLNPDAVPQMKGVDDLKGSSPLGVEVPGATGSATSSGGGTTSNILPDSGSAASGDSAPGVKSVKSGESAKSSSMTSNVPPDRDNATSGAGAATGKSATSADGTGSNSGTTGASGTAGVKSVESSESAKNSSMTSNVTPDRDNATSGAGVATGKSATSADGTGSNSGTTGGSATGASGTAGVKSVESGESTKSSSGATNIGPINSSATSSVAVSSFMPPRNAAIGDSVTGVNGAKTGNGMTDGNATRNVTPGKNSASGKNTKSGDGAKSNSGGAVNVTPGSDKTESGNNPPTGKKTKSGAAARKRASAADDDGATRKAPTPTMTSSRALPNRAIKGLTWKIRLPDFPALAARRRRAKS